MNEVMLISKKYNCAVLDQQMELFCRMDIGIPKANNELVLLKLRDIVGLEMTKI
jgi:hypothetical protein